METPCDPASVLNIAAYRFVPLHDLPRLQADLAGSAEAAGLKGTILLAEEGINLFLAGPPEMVRDWLARLEPPLAELRTKESWSTTAPFARLRVRIKREIIRMNTPTIVPAQRRAPAVTATTLRRWLDQGHDDAGRPVRLLDTRNRFEVDAGRFAGALDWNLSKFSEFPDALREHSASLQGHTVVSYCTGGIRCEKAALLMQQAGIEHTYQLEGGILQYFEDVPGATHWEGDCVVFDGREALTPDRVPAKAHPSGPAPLTAPA